MTRGKASEGRTVRPPRRPRVRPDAREGRTPHRPGSSEDPVRAPCMRPARSVRRPAPQAVRAPPATSPRRDPSSSSMRRAAARRRRTSSSSRVSPSTFEVSDDGDGFDPAQTGYGTGLQGMADRLELDPEVSRRCTHSALERRDAGRADCRDRSSQLARAVMGKGSIPNNIEPPVSSQEADPRPCHGSTLAATVAWLMSAARRCSNGHLPPERMAPRVPTSQGQRQRRRLSHGSKPTRTRTAAPGPGTAPLPGAPDPGPRGAAAAPAGCPRSSIPAPGSRAPG